ncbi:methylated-DNA--[protein]-cysteine S-methyltransferase [Parasphingopyxis sp. CP4]|uniref:methylated-DNA--[protein]-cysteine S-methyltransferase n=1 Tax=Parasphingopyxis sp. CP4 TaxID=2724527 RepID=UPI0015A3C2B1|nr:methylated-DNA--[protein]-cysteine S-methyltransferase [Parasphingopyxis sp. CP4]QLC23147.1 methylated-DNA--[protein]-cysteine S-methyltransferase [Parasphingopyxis sp. CP4]
MNAEFTLFPTAIGDCCIAWRGDLVVAASLPEKTPAATAARVVKRTGARRAKPPPAIDRAIQSIIALLEGEKADLSFVACDLGEVDEFAEKVYAVTCAIPAGETLTYGEVALQLGDKLFAQRVGQALGRNPIPIIVPCHRVVGANGKLTGFSAPGGVETKLKMLEIEGAHFGGSPTLFGDLPLAVKPQK